jgi:hypothetical protein
MAWATETFVGKFSENAVRVRARLPALSEAEEAQSSTGGLLRDYVGAMTTSDKGSRRGLLCRERWSGQQRVHALANCQVGAAVEEGIAAYVKIFVVGGLRLLFVEGVCRVVCQCPEA